jgi:hypothetical protein
MAKILNLTQHQPTPSQQAEGVQAPLEGATALLTFNTLPNHTEIRKRARALAVLASDASDGTFKQRVMVGGAPYLMPHLVEQLDALGLQPVFSFTERRSVEKTMPDGTVTKTAVFEHIGWVEA